MSIRSQLDREIGRELRAIAAEVEVHVEWKPAAWMRLRADQFDPPRIPEPGIGGSVIAEVNRLPRTVYHRCASGWSHEEDAHYCWEYLTEPTLVRKGVDDL